MENKILSYRETGGWLLVIFIVGLLNAISDAVMLLQTIVKAWGMNTLVSRVFTWLIPFSGIFVNQPLFLFAAGFFILVLIANNGGNILKKGEATESSGDSSTSFKAQKIT
ncbi:MAG: hypothetical protein Pg6C_04140 [Treponemataceae bacterium]|nr:MAG: hypothetical protein Pg6C_04140 [Treponemataceae bacterium]